MKQRRNVFIHFIIILLGFGLFFLSCKKDPNIDTDPSLQLVFSNDSIIFDTVFTTLGSSTQRLMIYNQSNQRIKISTIQMTGGSNSEFRINLDGEANYTFSDIEIAGGDSLYLFARVTIDPNDINNPFVVEDEINFLTNGNSQAVKLIAWGQNANYIVADTYIPGFPPFKVVADSLQTVHWTSERPYVVFGYAVINSYGKLIIEEGTRVFFHKGAGLWAYADGVLKVMGTRENNVTFRGDRLESFYSDVPGQWDRIWLMEGRQGEDHEIRNAVIENGFIGIQAESFLRPTQNAVILENVVIQNMTGFGVFTRLFTVESSNTVVANCGSYCLAFTGGGNYDFKQSTIANFWPFTVRNTPAVYLTNYLSDTLGNPIPLKITFNFSNGIIYGYNQNEFLTDMVTGADSVYYLTNCILKSTRNVSNPVNFNKILKNENPLFIDYHINDYRLDTLSPAIGFGDPALAATVPDDLLGNPRLPNPDLGAYQFVPGQNGGR